MTEVLCDIHFLLLFCCSASSLTNKFDSTIVVPADYDKVYVYASKINQIKRKILKAHHQEDLRWELIKLLKDTSEIKEINLNRHRLAGLKKKLLKEV